MTLTPANPIRRAFTSLRSLPSRFEALVDQADADVWIAFLDDAFAALGIIAGAVLAVVITWSFYALTHGQQ